MSPEFINPPGVSIPETYSQLCRAGNLLYVAGQTGQDEQGNVVAPGDPEAQADQAFRNIITILRSQGAGPEAITSMRVYVTEAEYRPAVSASRARHLARPFPPSTFLVVKALALPELLVEVEVTAMLPEG